MNVNTLLARNKIIDTLDYVVVMVSVGFLIALAITRTVLIIKLKKMMKARKLI
jgi:hypothetical protein